MSIGRYVMPSHFSLKLTINTTAHIEELYIGIEGVATHVPVGLSCLLHGLRDGGVVNREFSYSYGLRIMSPHRSTDLNPLTTACGASSRGRPTNQLSHNTEDSMKASVVDIIANADENHVFRLCSCFRGRIDTLFEAKGVFIFFIFFPRINVLFFSKLNLYTNIFENILTYSV